MLDWPSTSLFGDVMDIHAIFQKDFKGVLSGATWIIDTYSNRRLFEGAKRLDPNSALFSLDRYETAQEALCHIIWGIQDHFPNWDTITVIGMSYDEHTARLLRENECWLSKADCGFVSRRMVTSLFAHGQAVRLSKHAPPRCTQYGFLASICGIEQTPEGFVYLVEAPCGNAVDVPEKYLSALA